LDLQEDEDGVNTLLKVWRLDRMEKGSPFCSRVSRVSQHLGNRPAKATAVAAHSSLGYAAVGFEDSSVLLFKGDVTKERYWKFLSVQKCFPFYCVLLWND
jgi:hypothetical protein